MLVSTQHTVVGASILNTALLLLLMCTTQTLFALRLIDYTPRNGPISGGTLIHIQGEDFITTGSGRSKCRFQQHGRGSVLSLQNNIINSSYLVCEMPQITFLTESELRNGHMMNLNIITGTRRSNNVLFLVYDLSFMSITHISPDEGLTNSCDITLLVSTSGVLNTSELTCSLAELRSETLVPATFINSTFLQCQLLPYPETSVVQIEVSLNGQSAANIPTANDVTQITYFSPAPELLSCQFTPSYALLLLSFDREVEIGAENRSMGVLPSTELSCEMLFTTAALEIIGSDSQCYWRNTQQRRVIIQLTANSQVQLGTVLTIRSDTIRTRYLQYSRLVSDSITVSSLLDPQLFRPSAIIEAPRIIPTCGNYTISGAKSQYGGVRALQYEWIIGTEVNASIGRVITDLSLASYVPEGFTRQSLLELPAAAFSDDGGMSGSGSGITPIILARNYTIQLSVKNFLGVVSTAHVDGISRAERLLPTLVIIGGTLRHLQSSLENTLQGMITIASGECSQDNDILLQYSWNVSDDTNREVEFDGSVNTNSSVLVLPPGLLIPDSVYTAMLAVRYGGENDVISDIVTIVTDVEIRAMIKGGDRRALGVNHVIILDGSISKGVTLLPSNTTLIVSWDCRATTTNDSCIGQNGEPVSLSNAELVYTIEAGQLASETEYEFSLTLSLTWNHMNGIILESSAHQSVLIFPYSVPIVELYPSPGLDLNAVLIQRELTLLASIQSSIPGNVSWTAEYVAGYGQLELREDLLKTPLNLTIIPAPDIESQQFTYREDHPVLFTSPVPNIAVPSFTNRLSLVIKKNSLLSRNSYRLKLTAADMLGRAGFVELDIRTATQPTSGLLEITPLTGRPLSTLFTLSALGWTDDLGDTPLLYRFGLRYHYTTSINVNTAKNTCCGGTTVNDSCVCDYWLSGIIEVNQLSTILPFTLTNESADNSSIVNVSVILQVYDNKGAVTEVVKDLRQLVYRNADIGVNSGTQPLQPISGESNEMVDISTLLDDIGRMLRETGDWIQTMAHLTAVIATVESELTHNVLTNQISPAQLNLTEEVVELFQLKATQLIVDVYDSYIPLSKSYLCIIASLLHKTTKPLRGESPCNTPLLDSTITKLASLLENVVAVYNTFERGAAFSYAGLDKRDSFLVLDVLQNLILARSETEERADTRGPTILRIRADDITRSLLRIVPNIGYGICLQQALNEEAVFVHSSTSFISLKSSWINLPNDYRAGNNPEFQFGENIIVNFSRAIFRQYLQWQCTDNNATTGNQYCSGVCVASAQYTHNIVWQGSAYSSQTKTSLLQLLLINPVNGVNLLQSLTTQKRQTTNQNTPIGITFPIVAPFSNHSNLICAHWQEGQWIENGCMTKVLPTTSSTNLVCQCSAELSSSPLTVLERCPDGYYGELCENVCPQGLWGSECQRSCDCNNRGLCSPVDGSCDCIPGWMGSRCEDRCSVGTWGDGCSEVCLCENGASCDPVSGSCTCTPGWIGTHCNIPCQDGFYGDNCDNSCACRVVTECTDKINGGCTCQAGFTGTTCEQTCPTGLYGLGCASECECSLMGTRVCDHITGLCDCLDSWRGFLCEIEVTTPPPTTPIPVSPFEIWWIVVGVVAVIFIVAVITIVIIVVVVCVRKKNRSKVLPISEPAGSSQSYAWKREVATSPGSSDGSELELTRTHSLEVLIPPGKSLKDMFLPAKTESVSGQDFKEPDKINDKLRWQVVRLRRKKEEGDSIVLVSRGESRADDKSTLEQKSPAKSVVMESSVDGEDEDHVTEVIYKRGIYLTSDSALKHLRNAFIDSEQLDSNDRYFQFLKSDVPGDYIEIDTEDEILLVQIETSLLQHRTLYIESIDSGGMEAELCVCGKYADMECSNCERRGYCSSSCQRNDWLKHEPHCRNKHSAIGSRREKKSSKKHRKKKHRDRDSSRSNNSSRKTPVGMLWLNEDICICGKEAEFECSKCGKQGYCTQKCQEEDWSFHEYYCNQPGGNTSSRTVGRTVITPTKQPALSVINSDKKLLTVQEESDEERPEHSH